MANTPMKNNAQALNTADGKFDIPAILDPIDIVNVPDDHSMMTYVSYFRAYEANRGTYAYIQYSNYSIFVFLFLFSRRVQLDNAPH